MARDSRYRAPAATALVSLVLMLTSCPGSRSAIAASVPQGEGPHCTGSTGDEVGAFGSANDLYEDEETPFLPKATPGSEGLSPTLLAALGDDMSLSSTVRSMLVVRNGKLVYERYFNGAARRDARNIYSIEKSVVGLLTGIAIDRGEIESVDTPIAKLLPKALADEPGAQHVTVRELLTMSSGLATEWGHQEIFDRIAMQDHRVRAILRESHPYAPGAKFSYSTLGTYLLGAVLAHASGHSLCDLAQDRLFSPIGVTLDHAHTDLEGYFSGSMFLTPAELARIGQLVLQRGAWDTRRVVGSAWIGRSMTQRWELPCHNPDRNGYGYLWWLSSIAGFDAWSAEGAGGQSITVVPDLELVVVVTHLNDYPEEKEIAPYKRVVRRIIGALTDGAVDIRTATCPLRDIHLARADGREAHVLQDDPALDVAFDWSPDGTRILFVSDRSLNAEIYSMERDGSDVRRLTRNYHQDLFPSYAPDGRTIAFASDRGKDEDIFVMNAVGKRVRMLIGFPGADDQAPTWSPDGKRLAFTSGDRLSGLGRLWVVNADGTHARILVDRQVRFPRWSPDGSRIAFGMQVGTEPHVAVLRLKDGRLTDLGAGDGPSWAPDGIRLAAALSDGVIEIVSVSDRSRERLPMSVKGVPLLSPDGRWLVWTT